MTVFREKNGAMKAVGYLRGRTIAQIRPGLLTFEQSISLHPQVARGSAQDSMNERNVRAVQLHPTALSGEEAPSERKS